MSPLRPLPFIATSRNTNTMHENSSNDVCSADGGCLRGSPRIISFLDLPLTFMVKLVDEEMKADPKGTSALFKTCTAMRDLVLHYRCVILPIKLGPGSLQDDYARLGVACKLSSNVNLHLYEDSRRLAREVNASAGALLGRLVKDMGPLKAVRSVQMQNLALDALIPSWLATHCPNLTYLAIHRCDISQSQSPSSPATTTNILPLKHLELHSVYSVMSQSSVDIWRQQLHKLPNLRSLNVTSMGPHGTTPLMLHACQGVPLDTVWFSSPSCTDHILQLPLCLNHTRELVLTSLLVDDSGLDILLSMASVRKLHCKGFQLEKDHCRAACPFTQLGFRTLDVASFARLPLHTITVFEWVDCQCTIVPTADVEVSGRVAAALAHCGGVRLAPEAKGFRSPAAGRGDTVPVTLDCMKMGQAWAWQAEAVPGALPIVFAGHLHMLDLLNVHVTIALLIDLERHMAAPATAHGGHCPLTAVHFWRCSWGVGVWPRLLKHLSGLDVIRLIIESDDVSVDDVSVMCANAVRPQVVEVRCTGEMGMWRVGWEEPVRRAMTVAGHQLVQLR